MTFPIFTAILIASIAVGGVVSDVSAHPGGLASDGCHYCQTNCSSWGVRVNARHCHRSQPKTPDKKSDDKSGYADDKSP